VHTEEALSEYSYSASIAKIVRIVSAASVFVRNHCTSSISPSHVLNLTVIVRRLEVIQPFKKLCNHLMNSNPRVRTLQASSSALKIVPETTERANGRGFSSAVGTQKAEDLSFVHGECDVVNCFECAKSDR
jgi:hypothetical protein